MNQKLVRPKGKFKIQIRTPKRRAKMESKDKAELINLAIQKIREERKNNEDASSAQEDQLVISNLLSQLESLEGGGVLKQPGGIPGQEEANSSAVGEVETEGDNAGQLGGEGAEISREEIINELRHVKRQNFITHCLLSAMIFLTLSWQLSEVKLILKVRDGINHPFKAVGSMLKGMFKRPRDNGRDAEQQQQHEAPQHSPFKMPELPHMDLPELGMNGKRH